MKSRRSLSIGLVGIALGSLVSVASSSPAFACHETPGQQHDDVCIAVGECHILVIADTDPGSWRYDPPSTGVVQKVCWA